MNRNALFSVLDYARIRLRWLRHGVLRGGQLALYGGYETWKRPQRYLTWPKIENQEELEILMLRINWFLPNSSQEIIIWASQKSTPQERDFAMPPNVSLVTTKPELRNGDWLLIHDISGMGYLYYLRHIHRAVIVDPSYYSDSEPLNWKELAYLSISSDYREEAINVSKENWKALAAACANSDSAVCFATGPTLESASNFKYPDNSVRIICNSSVCNDEFLKKIKPQVLTFMDIPFFMGPSAYSQAFRKDAITAFKKHKFWIIVPLKVASLLLRHYPVLKDRLIGLQPVEASSWILPNADKLRVRKTTNILKTFMLPVAGSLASNIIIVGADGMRLGRREGFFWQHSRNFQYSDLMKSICETHPAFCRDRLHDRYYKRHCRDLADMGQNFEQKKNISVHTWTKSHMPCLASRYQLPETGVKGNIAETVD